MSTITLVALSSFLSSFTSSFSSLNISTTSSLVFLLFLYMIKIVPPNKSDIPNNININFLLQYYYFINLIFKKCYFFKIF